MTPEWAEFKEACDRYDIVRSAFIEMCRDAASGKATFPLDVGLKMAEELKRLHAEFMKAGEPFSRMGPRMG
jgi:hypothetical protein